MAGGWAKRVAEVGADSLSVPHEYHREAGRPKCEHGLRDENGHRNLDGRGQQSQRSESPQGTTIQAPEEASDAQGSQEREEGPFSPATGRQRQVTPCATNPQAGVGRVLGPVMQPGEGISSLSNGVDP